MSIYKVYKLRLATCLEAHVGCVRFVDSSMRLEYGNVWNQIVVCVSSRDRKLSAKWNATSYRRTSSMRWKATTCLSYPKSLWNHLTEGVLRGVILYIVRNFTDLKPSETWRLRVFFYPTHSTKNLPTNSIFTIPNLYKRITYEKNHM